jgi:hypothetical protein
LICKSVWIHKKSTGLNLWYCNHVTLQCIYMT